MFTPADERTTESSSERSDGRPNQQLTLIAVAGGIVVLLLAGLLLLKVVQALDAVPDLHRQSTAGQSEWIAARADHDAILDIARECANDVDQIVRRINESGDTARKVPVSAHLLSMTLDEAPTSLPTGGQPEPIVLPTPNSILPAIVLSYRIGWSRVALAEQERESEVRMNHFQWCIVLIGAITTILISIKTISQIRPGLQIWIGVIAMIFSTLGTATATMHSFYAPRIVHDHAQQGLQTLQALHLQLTSAVVRDRHPCDPPKPWPNDWRAKRIKAITDQYVAAIGAAHAPANAADSDETEERPKEVDHTLGTGTQTTRGTERSERTNG